jgi:ferrous iron transport protein A
MEISLASLSPGQKGKITALDLPDGQKGRVMEMGLTVGTTIEFIKVAPMGDPIQYKVRGSHISLRKAEAALIQVQPIT